jgi:hypothetical protein
VCRVRGSFSLRNCARVIQVNIFTFTSNKKPEDLSASGAHLHTSQTRLEENSLYHTCRSSPIRTIPSAPALNNELQNWTNWFANRFVVVTGSAFARGLGDSGS